MDRDAWTDVERGTTVLMALEMILLPVADIDRAKAFYEQLGFSCDVDHRAEELRVVQFTPPGSGCSIAFGKGLGDVTRSPVVGMHLVVADLNAALEEIAGRGIQVGEAFHYGPAGKEPGVHPDHPDYGSYAELEDPDGNLWLLQEVPSRASTHGSAAGS